MTNKEAIEYLKWIRPIRPYSLDKIKVQESIDLAIKALERDGSLSYDEVITSVFSCPVCGAIWRDKEQDNDT